MPSQYIFIYYPSHCVVNTYLLTFHSLFPLNTVYHAYLSFNFSFYFFSCHPFINVISFVMFSVSLCFYNTNKYANHIIFNLDSKRNSVDKLPSIPLIFFQIYYSIKLIIHVFDLAFHCRIFGEIYLVCYPLHCPSFSPPFLQNLNHRNNQPNVFSLPFL